MSVEPRDGLRQRLAVVGPGGSAGAVRAWPEALFNPPAGVLRIEVDRDGFAAEAPMSFDRGLRRVAFRLENRTGDRHKTVLSFAPPGGADRWEMRVEMSRREASTRAR